MLFGTEYARVRVRAYRSGKDACMTDRLAPAAAFDAYLAALVSLGHDRHWVRHNIPVLRIRYARDALPFPPLPEPEPVARDRYDDLFQ